MAEALKQRDKFAELADALSVRRVRREEGVPAWLEVHLQRVAAHELKVAAVGVKAGRLQVALRVFDAFGFEVAADQAQLAERAHLLLKRRAIAGVSVGVVALPGFKAIAMARQTRRAVGRDQRGFDQDRARPNKRIEDWCLAIPLARQHERRTERFGERRNALRAAPTAAMQAVPRAVDLQRHPILKEVDADAQVGLKLVHRRTLTGALDKLIDDRILNALLDKHRVVEARLLDLGVDAQAARRAQVARPVLGRHARVERIRVGRLKTRQAHQNPHRRAQPQVGLPDAFLVGFKVAAAHLTLDLGQLQGAHFLVQKGL